MYKNHKQQGFVSGDKGKATNLWVFGIERVGPDVCGLTQKPRQMENAARNI
jgi:hypothetical protein